MERTSSQRKALLRNQVTICSTMAKSLQQKQKLKKSARLQKALLHGSVKEKDNFEEVKLKQKLPVRQRRQESERSCRRKESYRIR